MKREVLILSAAVTVAIAGCGSLPADSSSSTASAPPTSSAQVADTQQNVLAERGFPDTCPTTGESFNMMNQGTYQVFGQIDQVDQTTGQPTSQHIFIGTAWGVDDHLLATNAHVTGAFKDAAENGVQFSRAIAVQSGTGTVVRLLRALTHPDYSGDPLGSPDVGLFTTQESIPLGLPLAADDSVVDLGGEFQLVGFPGDVDDAITVKPGETVPQATSLTGTVTARRSHDDTQIVTGETLDMYQHQAPTTPGTSGSAIVHCGLVFGINNAGTIKMVVMPSADGQYTVDRTAAASNNFAVHVRYIHQMVELFQANAIQGFELPVPAVIQQQPVADGSGIMAGQPDPGGQPGGQPGGDPGGQVQENVLTFQGTVETPSPHAFDVSVDLTTGDMWGMSDWGGAQYQLTGTADVNSGEFMFWDNAPDANPNLAAGYYFGYAYPDGSMEGYYAEDEVTTYPLQGMVGW